MSKNLFKILLDKKFKRLSSSSVVTQQQDYNKIGFNSNNLNKNILLNNKHRKSDTLFFIIMRLNLRAGLLFLCMIIFTIITLSVYMRCSDFQLPLVSKWDSTKFYSINSNTQQQETYQNIDCIINQEQTIPCKRDINNNNEIFIPFSFIKNYFEIFGTLSTETTSSGNLLEDSINNNINNNNNNNNGVTKFIWSHTNSKLNIPKGRYDPKGLFMYFENYNVEIRDRVKCVSAEEGVPISTQWEKRGYFYPTQIAQFGLSHYSKNLTEPEPRIKIIEDGDNNQIDWITPKLSNITRVFHSKLNTTVVHFFTTNNYDSSILLKLDYVLDLVLSMDVYLMTNSSSIRVVIENRETKHTYFLNYIVADLFISVQGDNIYYGLGVKNLNKWKRLTRDLLIDVQKGLYGTSVDHRKQTQKLRRSELKIVAIEFLGVGFFDNLTLSTYDHIANFYAAAEWFVHHQDPKTGGWPNPVKRNLSGFQELRPGWLSAMGQGHGISVLARAYYHSNGDKRFLKAAVNALKPFRILSKDGGVLAKFMGQYDWYEEYPTTPASFVLNGFIYSLLGLYDLNSTAPTQFATNAGKLFKQGMISLKKLLTLYDTGSGTSYDLRHFTLGVAPNLARWDYHAAHVNQLLLLATIDNDPIISQTAERWKGYMFGKRAKHN